MTLTIDIARSGEYPAADRSEMLRKIHNTTVVQSVKGWTRADAQQGIRDAAQGIVYRRTVQSLFAERQRVLAIKTTTEAEYREKWSRVNRLTKAIALANGATEAELERY